MAEELNVHITNVSLLNQGNEILVTVQLDQVWEQVLEYDYIYLLVSLQIPVNEQSSQKTILLDLQSEFLTKSISSETKLVELTGEFGGEVDLTREVMGTAVMTGYDKQ